MRNGWVVGGYRVSILLEFGYGEKDGSSKNEIKIQLPFQSFLNLDMGKKNKESDYDGDSF